MTSIIFPDTAELSRISDQLIALERDDTRNNTIRRRLQARRAKILEETDGIFTH